MEGIENFLNSLISVHIAANHKEPSVIIMHPNDYEFLKRHLDRNRYFSGELVSYNGIKLIKSLDTKEGSIEAY